MKQDNSPPSNNFDPESLDAAIELDGSIWIRRIIRICFLFILVIGLADLFLNYYQWIPWRTLRPVFNITREDGLGNWFSSVLALANSLVLGAIFYIARKKESIRSALNWGVIACFFLYFAFDDATRFHERLGISLDQAYTRIMGESLHNWFPSYPWQLFIAPPYIVIGIYILWFLWKSIKPSSRIQLCLSVLFFSAAIGLDFVEGTNVGPMKFYYIKHTMKLIEELLEMAGMTIFLSLFLNILHDRVQITFFLKD